MTAVLFDDTEQARARDRSGTGVARFAGLLWTCEESDLRPRGRPCGLLWRSASPPPRRRRPRPSAPARSRSAPTRSSRATWTSTIPTPGVDGYITDMDVDVVDARRQADPDQPADAAPHRVRQPRPDDRLQARRHLRQLHAARTRRSTLPGLAERFYAAGEERAKLRLPDGYGYPINGADKWGMTWMLMNHRKRTDTAYIQYRVTYDTAPQDARDALLARRRELPGRPGLRHPRRRASAAPPPRSRPPGTCRRRAGSWRRAATCTAAPRSSTLKRTGPDCTLYSSRPTWGAARPPLLQRQARAARAGPDQHERLHQRRAASPCAAASGCAWTPTTTASCCTRA